MNNVMCQGVGLCGLLPLILIFLSVGFLWLLVFICSTDKYVMVKWHKLCLYVIFKTFLFSELKPYKYAGYPMLIKTITIETSDDLLFSKESPLLPAATELAFHTVNCSALNAEELRRENGMEVDWKKLIEGGFVGFKSFPQQQILDSSVQRSSDTLRDRSWDLIPFVHIFFSGHREISCRVHSFPVLNL